jgi:hypothetical protein
MENSFQAINFLIKSTPHDKRLDSTFLSTLKQMIIQPKFNEIDAYIRNNIEYINNTLKLSFKKICQTTLDQNLYNYIFCDKNQLDDTFYTPFNFIKLYVDHQYTEGLNYFTYLCMYYKLKNIPIFDLGDSLHKFVIPFNAFNDNYIKKILLSGNIYDNVYGPKSQDGIPEAVVDVKINEEKRKDLDSKLDFLEYTLFKDVISFLKENKQVVIIDYGNSGRALLTLKYIFEKINSKYNFNLKNLILIWFSADTKAILGNIKKYLELPFSDAKKYKKHKFNM